MGMKVAIVTFRVPTRDARGRKRWENKTVTCGPFRKPGKAVEWAERLIRRATRRGIRRAHFGYTTREIPSPRQSLNEVLDLEVQWPHGGGCLRGGKYRCNHDIRK